MGSIKLPHASGNSMSIAAPATNPASDLELKLPATIGTANQYLKNSGTPGTLEFATLAGGKILQIVTGETTTETDVASTTMTDTTLTATITPSATSSKIWVIANQRWSMDRLAVGLYAGLQLLRDSTVIVAGSTYCQGFQDNSSSSCLGQRARVTTMKMDSPSTTSAITYKTQGTCGSTTANSANVTFQEDSELSSIFLLEVGA